MRMETTAKQSREELAARKVKITGILDQAIDIFEKDGREDRVEIFRQLKEDFVNEEYSIIVVGEFSAGKSTMLNALMGKRILTSLSGQATATINFLRHKEAAKAGEEGRVFYVDGSEESIPAVSREVIERYVSTKGDNVAKRIKRVDLYLDSDFLKDRISIIDSPGLNGIEAGHREITEAQILKSHACIFLFTADKAGGTNSEFESLSAVQNQVKTIFFVINKIDTIKFEEEETVETVVEKLKQNYKKVFPELNQIKVPEIWPISAGDALRARDPQGTASNLTLEEQQKLEEKSRMGAFEARLMRFLSRGEKTRGILLDPLYRVQNVAKTARDEYNQEMELLQGKTDSSEVENQIEELKAAMEDRSRKAQETKRSLVSAVKKINRNVLEMLGSELGQLKDKKINAIKGYVDMDNLDEVITYLQNFGKDFSYQAKRLAGRVMEKLGEEIETEILSSAEEHLRDINLEFDQSEIALSLESQEQLQVNEDAFSVGLEKMDERSRELEMEIVQLEQARREKEQEFIEARKSERKLKELRREKQNLEASRESIEHRSLPGIEHISKTLDVEVLRGGILGFVGNILLGAKQERRVVHERDDSAYQEAKKKQESDLNKLDMEKQNIQRRIEAITDKGDPDMLELLESQRDDMERQVAQRKQELREESENKQRRIKEKTRKNIRNLQRKLEDVCEDMSQEAEQQIKAELKKREAGFVEVISANVEKRIQAGLAREEERLEKLKEQLDASEQDKHQRLSVLQEKDGRIKELMTAAAELSEEIEGESIDYIEEEEIKDGN